MEAKGNETMEQSFVDRQFIKLYFVLKDNQEKEDTNELFIKAFELSEEKMIEPEWITESELKKQTLTKKIICVLQKFEGYLFDELRSANCLILGPLCILCCLMKGEPAPNGPNPVFSLAMQGVTVCVTGLSHTQKLALKEKVEFMGGRFQRTLTPEVTHLVTNQTTSDKYCVAAKKKMPVMLEQWIHETWSLCQVKNVHGTDPPLMSLRCPTFHNLQVCASQIGRAKKDHIKKMIETQGGVYCTTLNGSTTDLVVAGKGGSEKVMAAQKWKISCVRDQWVEDSYKAGYALKYAEYEIPIERCSTPDGDKTFADANFSMMSVISSTSSVPHIVNETIMNETTFVEPEPKKSRVLSLTTAVNKKTEPHLRTPEKSIKTPENESVLKEIEALEMKDIKKAGSFLDGCKVYLSGFTSSVLDKVRKILNIGGATRLDQITEGVSHVVVAGKGLSTEEQRAATQFQPHVVSAAWLLVSIKQRHQANIEPYLCYESQQSTEPSPASKKGLALWKKSPVGVAKNLTAESDIDMARRYFVFDPTSPDKNLSESERTPVADKVTLTRVEDDDDELAQPLNDEETEVVATGMFSGLKFWSCGFEDEMIENLQIFVTSQGATWSQANADYTVVPVEGVQVETSGQLVNQHWINECSECEEMIPIKYYHKPIQVQGDNKPLSKCVLAISSYAGVERNYLNDLGKALGALCQEVFAKKHAPERNALASTHLLCSTPTGSKYQAAIKWKLPVVTAEWLLACAQQGIHVSEEPYLLTGSVMVRKSTDTPNRSNATVICNATPCNNLTSVQSDNTMTPDHFVKPLSAIPPRLQTPSTGSKSTEPPPQETTPVNDKTLPDQFLTPTSANKTPSADTYTPLTSKTPSQQYTPYTPAPIPKVTMIKKETPAATSTPGVDMASVTPNSYNNYWSRKAPVNKTTPQTPYGDAIIDNPTPGTKKEWKQYLHINNTADTPLGRKRARDQEYTSSTVTEAKKHRQGDNQETEELCNQIVESEHVFKTPGPSSSRVDQSPSIVVNSVTKPDYNNTSDTSVTEEVELEKTVDEKENQVKYKFMFTGFDESERDTIEQAVANLGGEVSSVTGFDPSATHLVMNRPMRSEKLLASIAAGKWILHHSFIIESCKVNKFLNEEKFEWGNPRAEGLPNLTPNKLAESLSNACYRWRSRLQTSDAKGAFEGFKAILLTQPSKLQAFNRLIMAGGGETLDLEPPFSDPKDATHCFTDESNIAHIDKAALESKNVVIVAPVYLNDFLLKEISPQEWLENNKSCKRTPRR